MKRTLAFLLVLSVTVLGLTGCISVSLTPVQQVGDVVLPAPQEVSPAAPTGDSRAESRHRVTLYYISADQQQLTPLPRDVRLTGEETLPEKAVERLLEGEATASLLPIAPKGTRLNWLEQSQNIVTVDLTVHALALGAQELCWMNAALANTLTSLPGIDHVNILIGGRQESAMTLPSGAISHTNASLTALWAQLQADEDRFRTDPLAAQIERRATLYFGAWLDNRLLPELRTMVLYTDNFAEVLVGELAKGPLNTPQAHGVLPAGVALVAPPQLRTLEDGRRVLQLSFPADLFTRLEEENLSRWQLFSALTLTLCRFLPELDGLMIDVGDQAVTSLTDGVRNSTFPDGVLDQSLFDGAVGAVARLYFASEAGTLCAVERAMDRESAVSPRALLEQLIAGPYVFDAQPVFPEGMTDADLLGVRIEDRTALVNLSSNFYRLCQGFSPEQERNLVYAIVNTLTELNGVDRVRFYIGGELVESLAQSIYLKAALLPNPGIVE